MKNLILVAVLFMLASCAAPRYAPSTHRIDQDSTYTSAQRLDSLYRAIMLRDSIYRHDSIYVYVKGDTVTKYVERTTYHDRIRTDTIYRDKLRTDTVYINRTDSVTIETPIPVEKPIKWYNQGFIWLGRACCIAAILWGLFLYLKRKF